MLSTHAGWSVPVTGRPTGSPMANSRMLDLSQAPDPWPRIGVRSFLPLPLVKFTGRRVHPG